MKAIAKARPGIGLEMQDVPIPKIGDHEVLIKIHKTGICGTDLHIYNWDRWSQNNVVPPLVIGHEFVGHIHEVGSKVTRFKVGERVSGEGHITCGECSSCRREMRHLCLHTRGIGYHLPGCFAEYFALREDNVVPLTSDISDDVAAILDPLGNAVHTVLSADVVGEDVLITGAGPIGIMAAAICRHIGARRIAITDKNPFRLQLAKQVGATDTICIPAESINDSFRVGFEMSGSPLALQEQVARIEPGGTICLLGILPPETLINWDKVIFKMLHIKGIYGREIFGTWDKMLHMLQSGLNIAPVITHTLPACDFQKGLDLLFAKRAAKVLLDWSK